MWFCLNNRSQMFRRCALAALPLSLAIAPSAKAEPWEFSLTVYGWLSGLDGDVGVFPALPPANVDLSFSDVFDHLKFAGMGMAEARNGRLLLLADVTYVDVGADKGVSIRDTQIGDVSLGSEVFMSTLAGGYRVSDAADVDLLAGIRINSVDARVEFTRLNGTGQSASSSETWVDPVVGVRMLAPLGKNWALAVYGDIGGFGVSSHLTWQAVGTIQYQLSEHWRLAGGYRAYGVDYEKNGFVYDVTMSGPILGVTYRF